MKHSSIPPSGGDNAPEIADASSLFDGAPAQEAKPASPLASGKGDVFEVEERDERDPPPTVPKIPPLLLAGKTRPKKPPPKPKLEPSEAVEQVWSRGAEWGATLALLAVASLGLVVILYALVSIGWFSLAFLVLLGGGFGLVLLSYPILITLERPVRITPEQAVVDYFAALSHHLPHYRRMWLLLSREGRISPSFGSYEGFRSYWQGRLAALKSGRASSFTPLKFQVTDFRSEKSAGRTDIEATFAISIFVRGHSQEGPIEQFQIKTTLAKGPDRMWYLDRGTLP